MEWHVYRQFPVMLSLLPESHYFKLLVCKIITLYKFTRYGCSGLFMAICPFCLPRKHVTFNLCSALSPPRY